LKIKVLDLVAKLHQIFLWVFIFSHPVCVICNSASNHVNNSNNLLHTVSSICLSSTDYINKNTYTTTISIIEQLIYCTAIVLISQQNNRIIINY